MHKDWRVGVENSLDYGRSETPKLLSPCFPLSTLLHRAEQGTRTARTASTNHLKKIFNLKKKHTKKNPTHQPLNQKFLRIVPELVIFADLRYGGRRATESSYTFFRFLTRLKYPELMVTQDILVAFITEPFHIQTLKTNGISRRY